MRLQASSPPGNAALHSAAWLLESINTTKGAQLSAEVIFYFGRGVGAVFFSSELVLMELDRRCDLSSFEG